MILWSKVIDLIIQKCAFQKLFHKYNYYIFEIVNN